MANRRALDVTLSRACKRAARTGSELSLLLLDLDRFKQLNDALGHLAGDNALRSAAAALSRAVRRPYDLVARYGGEEFAVILPDAGFSGARHVAGTVHAVLRLAAIPHPASPFGRVSASIGEATAFGKAARSESLIAEADAAPYAAKRNGRDGIVFGYNPAGSPGGQTTTINPQVPASWGLRRQGEIVTGSPVIRLPASRSSVIPA